MNLRKHVFLAMALAVLLFPCSVFAAQAQKQAAAPQPTAAVPQTVAVQQQSANIDTPTEHPFTGGNITIQGGSPLG